MDRDPLDDARALVRERYPQAVWAVLAGSVLTAHRTAGSDLDIVVALPLGDPLAPRRESLVFRGWPVEMFVHDDETLDWWLGKERPQRKPTLHRMVCGTPVLGDPADCQAACRAILDAGPEPMAQAQLEAARYGLTDLLDDLVHATDPGERQVIAATLWTNAAHGALVAANRWDGAGKWLLRELRSLDEEHGRTEDHRTEDHRTEDHRTEDHGTEDHRTESHRTESHGRAIDRSPDPTPDQAREQDHHRPLADRWLAAQHDPAAIEAFAREVLDRLGGPLFDGYLAVAPRPDVTTPA